RQQLLESAEPAPAPVAERLEPELGCRDDPPRQAPPQTVEKQHHRRRDRGEREEPGEREPGELHRTLTPVFTGAALPGGTRRRLALRTADRSLQAGASTSSASRAAAARHSV